ncbi:MAG: ammonium transporter [Deltaproteobacteria bacterium]|nr:MAG: ammonium transporter [Deltaproteobacteria bacterium]
METLAFTTSNLWMMVATALVFVMHLGFACLEAGLTRSKNTVNILFKNTLIPCIGLLGYAAVGFSLMYPGEAFRGGVFGFAGFGIGPGAGGLTPAYNPGYTYWTDFLFQGMFAATAATIVSGAVAERVKLGPFLLFSALFVTLAYPVTGMWEWGGGFLDTLGFYDFAGSTLVHAVGGFGALAGALLLGPRKGKYAGGRINPIVGHSMPLATIGVFLLWLGWFGFNGGSVLSADAAAVSHVLVTTNLAAAAGGVAATVASMALTRKPDLSMALNGILAGLVGITAGADLMSPMAAILVGLFCGALVVGSVVLLDRLRIDDPVGAVSVHLVCGVAGTLAVGVLGEKAGGAQLLRQLAGVAAVGGFSFAFAFGVLFTLKKTVGIRVSEEEEYEGLDVHEHGAHAYDFGTRPAPGRARSPHLWTQDTDPVPALRPADRRI